MAISLALLSGKGGSGKTTLALSLAQLLALCGKRVLLIDCDMGTNGATYFFKDIIDSKNHYLTFNDILNEDEFDRFRRADIYKLNTIENIGFIPSSSVFPINETNNLLYADAFKNRINFISHEYDIVIYDCQSGYNSINTLILNNVEKSLIILEPDAVSVYAIRSLYTQYAQLLNNIQTYQVFSKVLEDEREAYKNIPHGTFFTNLAPISFDYSVRKAFSICTLPEINESNPNMTNEIAELAISLFQMYKIDIQKYMYIIQKRIVEILKEKIKNEKKKKLHVLVDDLFIFILAIFTLSFSVVFYLLNSKEFDEIINIIFYAALMISTLMMLISCYIIFIKNKKNSSYNTDVKLKKVKNDLLLLERSLNENRIDAIQ